VGCGNRLSLFLQEDYQLVGSGTTAIPVMVAPMVQMVQPVAMHPMAMQAPPMAMAQPGNMTVMAQPSMGHPTTQAVPMKY